MNFIWESALAHNDVSLIPGPGRTCLVAPYCSLLLPRYHATSGGGFPPRLMQVTLTRSPSLTTPSRSPDTWGSPGGSETRSLCMMGAQVSRLMTSCTHSRRSDQSSSRVSGVWAPDARPHTGSLCRHPRGWLGIWECLSCPRFPPGCPGWPG